MIKMRGSGGELRVGGVVAARLRSWTLENEVVTASADVDEFWMAEEGQRTLRLNIGRSLYVWRNVAASGSDPLIIAISGAPEIRG